MLAVGTLSTLVNSTLGTDLAAPAPPRDANAPALPQPGHASWSWALLKDDNTVYDVQKKFIDYAADMHWDYTLIDADWDRKIGYEKVQELAAYAAAKNVGVLVWYNSSGAWNQTEYSPKGKLLTREARRAEFARLQAMGVKGVKVDFFAGDGKSMIAYYIDILKDAADYGLLVNFHGATLPRGWARTYPNLMTAEAIKGLEFTTFDQRDQDAGGAAHGHAAVRAQSVRSDGLYAHGVRRYPQHQARHAQRLRAGRVGAAAVGYPALCRSAGGHGHRAALCEGFPAGAAAQLDDSRFVAGFPGKFAIIARKAGNAWYVAGINSEASDKTLDLDLSFIGKRAGVLMTDGAGEREFTRSAITAGKASKITIKPHGGFVAVFR